MSLTADSPFGVAAAKPDIISSSQLLGLARALGQVTPQVASVGRSPRRSVFLADLWLMHSRMDTRIVAFHVDIVFRLQEQVVLFDDLALLRETGHAQFAGRRTDDGPCL